jgi:hypothetical protein
MKQMMIAAFLAVSVPSLASAGGSHSGGHGEAAMMEIGKSGENRT